MSVPLPHPLTGDLFDSPVPPATGWPEDPGVADAAVARTAADVARLAGSAGSLEELETHSSVCRACPRLVAWRAGERHLPLCASAGGEERERRPKRAPPCRAGFLLRESACLKRSPWTRGGARSEQRR